jgi:lipopolysaccharide export system protein LptC
LGNGSRIAFAVLSVLAVVSWWLNRETETFLALEERPPPVGFYMTEAEITTAGPDGLPRYRLIADEIRQAAANGPTRLREVRVEYNVYSPNPWLLTADEGMLSADQSLLELWGAVELIGESGDHGRTLMDTERLEVDTALHVARTDEPVGLTVGDQQIRAVGMVAYLLEERVQLQSEVHGRFLP